MFSTRYGGSTLAGGVRPHVALGVRPHRGARRADVRLFVGIEIDERARVAAADAAARFRTRLSRHSVHLEARWVPAENLHVTLGFIGEVSDARAAEISTALAPPVAHPAFDAQLAGLGAFPPSGPPRVIWLGVRTGQSDLQALNAWVGARLQPIGIDPERRPYSAHVTLARVKDVPRATAAVVRQALASTPADAGITRVAAVTLFRSRVSAKGSVYEPLLRVPLG